MRHRIPSNRRGFTMIELLVVITVITLLMTLLVSASYRFVVGARESATAATLLKAGGILQDRVRAFREFDFSDAAIIASNNWNTNNSSDAIMTPALAEVLVRKARYKKSFPQSFAELDVSQKARFFPSAPAIPPAAPYDPKYESGIVLYAILTKGDTFGAVTPGDDTFSGAEVRITSQTGNLPCLVDAWGEPLRFYRWPTRLIRCGEQDFTNKGSFDDYNQNGTQENGGFGSPAIRPYSVYPGSTPASLLIAGLSPFDRTSSYALGSDGQPGVALYDDDGKNGVDDPGEIGWPDTDDPEPLNTDPDDPSFQLFLWLFDPNVTGAIQTTRRTSYVSQFHDFYTYHTPLIVSAGQDKKLGLFEPADTANFGYLAAPQPAPASMQLLFDNITNLNQRAGGK